MNDDGGGEKVKCEKFVFQATISEFKPNPPYCIEAPIHVSHPIHGTHPIKIPTLSNNDGCTSSSSSSPIILYMERGQNTFVEKTKNASLLPNHNVQGILCSNNNSTWPYTMKDSTGKGGTIPIVMVKKSDGQIIHSLLMKQKKENETKDINNEIGQVQQKQQTSMELKTQIKATKKSNDQNSCIIFTDVYKINDKITQLPTCQHFFHESCILQWLESHNTCPFCRIELPLEDEKEEDERRRRNTSTSTSGMNNGGNSLQNAGEGDNERRQWESIFG